MKIKGATARRLGRAGAIAVFSMLVMAPSTFAHHRADHDGGNGGSGTPNPAATPELGSVLLFGSGLMGLGAYGLTSLRARRRPSNTATATER